MRAESKKVGSLLRFSFRVELHRIVEELRVPKDSQMTRKFVPSFEESSSSGPSVRFPSPAALTLES